MGYALGKASLAHLSSGAAIVQRVVKHAIHICQVDFSVVETARSEEQQRKNIQAGVSWTMDSYHIVDENDEAWAVDIYPWVNGRTDHAPKHYKKIAKAMFTSIQEVGDKGVVFEGDTFVVLEWGGFWEKKNEDLPHWQFVNKI